MSNFRLSPAARFVCLAFLSSALLIPALVSAADALPRLPNPFFAMDTGTKDAQHQTPESQAQMLKELGYEGIGWSPGQVPEMRAALDRHKLRIFTVYVGLEIGKGQTNTPVPLVRLIEQLRGRDTILWVYITSKEFKPSDPAGDKEAVAVLRDLAARTEAAGLRVALYPHTWCWLERVQDAVRVVRKADRPNLGVTFNLCHALKVGDEAKFPDLLREAKPYLFLVTINGADHEGDWDRLIQPLDRGAFDVLRVLKALRKLGYEGPIGLQHYGIRGDARENLQRSMLAWQKLSAQAAAD